MLNIAENLFILFCHNANSVHKLFIIFGSKVSENLFLTQKCNQNIVILHFATGVFKITSHYWEITYLGSRIIKNSEERSN